MCSRRSERSAPRSSFRVVSVLSKGVLQERGRVTGPGLSVHNERESGGCAVGKEALVPGRTKGKGSWAGEALGTPAQPPEHPVRPILRGHVKSVVLLPT